MANVIVQSSGNNPDIESGNRVSVRTSGNRVYVFNTSNFSGEQVNMIKGNQDGEPTSFAVQDNLAGTGVVEVGGAIAIDSSDLIHCIYYQLESMGTEALRYVTYNTSTDTFGTPESIATLDNDDPFTKTLGIAIDVNDKPHVFFRDAFKSMGTTTFFNYYSNKISGSWSTKVSLGDQVSDVNIVYDIMIADPTSSTNADRPILAAVENNSLVLRHGDALNATSFTSTTEDSSGVATNRPCSVAIDSNEKITVAYIEISSNDLQIIEHLNSNAWGTWETPVTIDEGGIAGYDAPSIVINGTDRYIYVEDSTNSDLNLWKDTGSGFTEETADADLPNVGTFNDVKAKWSNYNNNSPTQLDYVFEDLSGDVLYNTFSVAAPPSVRDYHWHGHIPQPLF